MRGIVFPEGTADRFWSENGETTVTVSARRPVDAALLLKGVPHGRIRLKAGESQTFHFSE